MSATERVTVSLPAEIRQTAQRVADEAGASFSAVVADALAGWLRTRVVDAWLAEHQSHQGAFDEEELRALARDAGEAEGAGELLAASGTSDAADALLARTANPGDQVLTSDPDDLLQLTAVFGYPVTVVRV